MVDSRRGDRRLNAPGEGRFGRRTIVILGLFLVFQALWFALLSSPGPRVLQGDEPRYQREALSIASGVAPAPEFLWPPFQKWFLGGVFRVAGSGPIPLAVLQTLLLAAAALLFWRLAILAGVGAPAADAALALLLLDPQVGSFAFSLWPEITYLFLLGSALALIFLKSRPAYFLGGVSLGLTLLTKSVIGPFLPVIALAAVLHGEAVKAASRGLRIVLLAAGLAAVLVPLIVWNGLHHGVWGVGSSGAFNLWIGLEDPDSRTDYDATAGRIYAEYQNAGITPGDRDRAALARVRERVAQRGLLGTLRGQLGKQYTRLFDKNSFFTDQLAGGRFRRSEPETTPAFLARRWAWGMHALTLTLASFGLFLLPPAAVRKKLWLPLTYLGYCVGILLLLHVKTRYRVAFLPCVDLFAGCAVAWLVAPRKALLPEDATSSASKWRRLLAGTALSTLLLWLSFGP
ncbi:MAG: hypothetical protein ABIT01_16290 [Thermoanaerobaculia bacterium]